MNHTGFFFSGLLVGIVVSAAFGLDFFPTPTSDNDVTATFLESGSPAEADSSPAGTAEVGTAGQAQLVADLDASRLRVTTLEEQLATAQSALEKRESDIQALEARLESLTPDQLQAKLEVTQIELEKERQQTSRLKADLELSYEEAYNLLNQFFASKRSPEHAILISQYFATSAPETLKGDLVDQLLLTNRDVIAALSPMTSMVADGGDARSSGLVPVSARIGTSGPRPAVLRNDERGNLDAAQIEGAPLPPSMLPSGRKALPLPPPPGK